ncbi:hypothetical protein BU17DRAFT_61438 [Hysterangium stoloniferum]|nr:hypothetical protein BU17DRAFT_61438 [Hysterangium stoloniferum]
MAAVVTHSHSQQPSPHKRRSFMSIRRDKSADAKSEKTATAATTSPNRHPGYFDLYPTRVDKNPKQQHSKARSKDDKGFPFPSVNEKNDDNQRTPKASRSRPRPSSAPTKEDSQLPPLHFSGSSAFSHSPPATPTSSFPPDEFKLASFHPIRVIMSAPVVETTAMDALVDGMNGGEEDVFAAMDVLRGSRSRKRSTSKGFHHPLYHPPLPSPPPGVKLGVAVPRADSDADDDSSEDTPSHIPFPRAPRPRPSSSSRTSATGSAKTPKSKDLSRAASCSPRSVAPSARPVFTRSSQSQSAPPPKGISDSNTSIDEIVRKFVSINDTPPRTPVPSINEIIRAHKPAHKPYISVTTTPSPPSPVHEDTERQSMDEAVSRSSMDSVAEEVQRSLKVARTHPAAALQHARTFPRGSPGEEASQSPFTPSRRSDVINRSPSVSSHSSNTTPPSPYNNQNGSFINSLDPDSNHALATFLRSPRLTRLLKLRRHPNQRLQVSFSDLGSSTGKPIVVFLGLGSVRYIMGLYDEMAEALGLRLITIDRWGLGKTDNPSRGTPRGVKEWANVVEEVLDYLNIDRYGIMAHSAGAPYAMALANQSPHKVQGDLCLLAPWVGAGEGASGYKWLKYVPTGLIKTAQAAEWKVQAWMLGKPPAINTGIGYNVQRFPSSASGEKTARPSLAASVKSRDSKEAGRPSIGSFSDYDDLADFQGNYASRSTIHIIEETPTLTFLPSSPLGPGQGRRKRATSKSTRFFGGLWKGGDSSSNSAGPSKPRTLKGLKSMTSLRGAAAASAKLPPKGTRSQTTSFSGTIDDDWSALALSPVSPTPSFDGIRGHDRTRRSVSFSSPSIKSQYTHATTYAKTRRASSPPPSASSFDVSPSPSNAALGNALLAASHAESAKGTHADLLVILNHSQKPWGFSYHDFPHSVKVWYGEKDEKIAEGAVRWLEKTMRPGTCDVSVVKGAGHTLLYNGGVVVEALEFLKESWIR